MKKFKILDLGEEVKIKNIPSLFALDEEREFDAKGEPFIKPTRNGSLIIDFKKTLKIATERGFLKFLVKEID